MTSRLDCIDSGKNLPTTSQRTRSLNAVRNEGQLDPVLFLRTEEKDVLACKVLLGAILRVIVRENTASLSVLRRDLEDNTCAFLDDDACRPNLDQKVIFFALLEVRDVLFAVFTERQVITVQRAALVDCPEGRAQETLAKRDWVTCGSSVEDFLAIRADVSEGNEDVEIFRCRLAVAAAHAHDKVGLDVAGELGRRVKGSRAELERLASQTFIGHLCRLFLRLLGRKGEVAAQVPLDVFRVGNGPGLLRSEFKGAITFDGVELWVASSDEDVDSGDLGVRSLKPPCESLT